MGVMNGSSSNNTSEAGGMSPFIRGYQSRLEARHESEYLSSTGSVTERSDSQHAGQQLQLIQCED